MAQSQDNRPENPDAELIAACERAIAAEAEYRRRCYAGETDSPSEDYKRFHTDEYDPALENVRDISAKTFEGCKAKARAIHAFYDPEPPDDDSTMGEAIWWLICDLAGKPRGDNEEPMATDNDPAAPTESFRFLNLEIELKTMKNGLDTLLKLAAAEDNDLGDIYWIVAMIAEAHEKLQGLFHQMLTQLREDRDAHTVAMAALCGEKGAPGSPDELNAFRSKARMLAAAARHVFEEAERLAAA